MELIIIISLPAGFSDPVGANHAEIITSISWSEVFVVIHCAADEHLQLGLICPKQNVPELLCFVLTETRVC